jgi:hypothetical protein
LEHDECNGDFSPTEAGSGRRVDRDSDDEALVKVPKPPADTSKWRPFCSSFVVESAAGSDYVALGGIAQVLWRTLSIDTPQLSPIKRTTNFSKAATTRPCFFSVRRYSAAE